METDRHVPIEEMEVFRRYVWVADRVWNIVNAWSPLAQDTVGKQLIRVCDSVGANLAEGDGRMSCADGLQFFVIARASAREGRYWLQRAVARGLLDRAEGEALIGELVGATQLLNRLITYRRQRGRWDQVAEVESTYRIESDPFTADPLLDGPRFPNT
jgi:four helix bundle protein